MFDTSKDKAAAVAVFAQIVEREVGKTEAKRLMDIFVKNFLIEYQKIKKRADMYYGNNMVSVLENVYREIVGTKTIEQKAKEYGGSLGTFLAIVRYALVDSYIFGTIHDRDDYSRGDRRWIFFGTGKDRHNLIDQVEVLIAEIADALKSQNKRVNFYPIKRRIERIAAKNKLPDNHLRFLKWIATRFV